MGAPAGAPVIHLNHSLLRRLVREPVFWALVVILGLVALEVVYWLDGSRPIPLRVSGSWLYPVLIVGVAYVLAFSGSDHFRSFRALLTALSFSVAVASLFLLRQRPDLFDTIAREDGLIESVSAAALLLGSALFLVLLIRNLRRRHFLAAMLCGAFALVLFVIGMEEISWMQRVLDIESSDYFLERNDQNEMNLHNLDTGLSEKGYYFGGFLALIVVPYLHGPISRVLRRLGRAELCHLVPSPWIVLPSSLMVGYVGTHIQKDPTAGIAAAVAVLILFRLALARLDAGDLARFLIYGAFSALIALMAFYFTTYNYAMVEIRPWARKEYLEFFIALGLLAWAASSVHTCRIRDRAQATQA